jgi:hypothetical protein
MTQPIGELGRPEIGPERFEIVIFWVILWVIRGFANGSAPHIYWVDHRLIGRLRNESALSMNLLSLLGLGLLLGANRATPYIHWVSPLWDGDNLDPRDQQTRRLLYIESWEQSQTQTKFVTFTLFVTTSLQIIVTKTQRPYGFAGVLLWHGYCYMKSCPAIDAGPNLKGWTRI